MGFFSNFMYNQAIYNLINWEKLSEKEKSDSLKSILNNICDYYNFPKAKLSIQDFSDKYDSRLKAFFNGKDTICMDKNFVFDEKKLVETIIYLFHEFGHIYYCYKYEKEFLKFKKQNENLSKLDFYIKLKNEMQRNENLKYSYMIYNYMDFPSPIDIHRSNIPSEYINDTIKLLELNYSLNELEIAVDRFAHEHAVKLFRDLNALNLNSNKPLLLVKECYQKYETFEKEKTNNLYKKTKLEEKLAKYFNGEINSLKTKKDFHKTMSIINYCSIPQLQDFVLTKLNMHDFVQTIYNSNDHHAIVQLARLPFIEPEDVRDHLYKLKNTSGLLLLETCVSSNLNKTLNYLENCKLDSNIHSHYFKDLAKNVKDKKQAISLYKLASKVLNLKNLNDLNITHLVDKEIVHSIMRNKILSQKRKEMQ